MGVRVCFLVVLVALFLTLQIHNVKTADEINKEESVPASKEVNLKVSDIGYNWVYLTWDEASGNLSCNDEIYMDSNEMNNIENSKIFRNLQTSISYNCSIENVDMDLRNNYVNFTPGVGIAKSSDHNRVMAQFVGDKNSTRLSCTVMNGDVQTDTVWSIISKDGKQIQITEDNKLFKICGNKRESSKDSNFNYGNHLDIVDCSVKDLYGAVISCGSYVNPSQVNVTLFVCDEPSVMLEKTVNVWEGHVDCSIDVMTSNLNVSEIYHELQKDDYKMEGISVNGFSITFDEVKKEDAGNYFAEFCIPCHKDSSPKCFNHTFYLNVMYEPTMSEVTTNYSFSKGEQANLVIGENLESNPEAVVTWTTPQGVTFKESNERYTMSSGPEKVQLSISGVSERDNGTWTVTVEVLSTETFKNCPDQKRSSRKKEFHKEVIVVVPPSEPQNVYMEEINTTTVLVRWEEPSELGSPYLTGYRLCYNSTCTPLIQSVSTEVTLVQGNIYNISVYALSTSDKTTRNSHPGTIIFTMDYVHNLEVTDIGYDWVYLSWDKLDPSCGTSQQHYNISCTCSESLLSFTTMETSYNVSDIPTNVQVNCSVVAISSDDSICSLYSESIVASPGAGIVKELSDHNEVIAHFVGDKNSTRLSCTVMNGDVQTDTVWSVTYKDSEQIQITQDNNLFKISGDIRQSSLNSNFFNYGNYLDIIDCSVKELDRAVISCGSYVNPSQVNVSMLFVCDEPIVMSDSIINVWEGHVGCSIDVMTSNLKASRFELLKDGHKARIDDISVNELRQKDARNYSIKFCIPCYKDSSPKCFNHTFYLNVMYGPTLSIVQTNYLFSGGDQADVVIGENLKSNPEAVVTWTTPQGVTFKNSNGRYTMSSGPEKVQLSISNVSESDNGTWTVTVEVLSTETFKNCSDQNRSSRKKEFGIELIVVVPSSMPRYIDVEQLNTTTVSISWTEPSSRGSPHLTGYRLCYNSTCITTLDSNAFNGVEINLDEGKLYVITVYAISKSDDITRESPPATKMFTMGAKTKSNRTLYYMIGIGITMVMIYGMYMRPTSKRSKPGRPKPSQVFEASVELMWEPDATSNSYAVFYRSEHDPDDQWNRQDTNSAEARTKVEEKPLVVPVKTEVKEEAVTVTKDEIISAQPTAAWDLRGVEVCGEMTVVVHSSTAQQITWEGFGLKLHIDEGSLPAGIHQCTLTIKASRAGQYEFPDNSYLVSAIFWLRCEPMFKFTKPVTVEMQHCARSENVANLKLKFVRAFCSQKQRPYTFKELGGDFTRNSSYGVVEVNGFSGLAITQEGSSECNYLTNLLSKEVKGHPTRVIVEIFFVVIRKMDSHRTVMLSHDHFKDAKLMTYQPIEFESDCVEFQTAKPSRNWRINKLNSPIIKKEDVDSFTLHETSWIPHSHFKAKYFGDSSVIKDLECAVNIIGARRPHNALTIDISPEGPVSNLQLSGPSPPALQTSDPVATRLSSVRVSFLLQQLCQHSAKWRDIGGALGFTQGELDTIQASPSLHASAPNSWLTKMLAEWLQWAPGDGRESTHFATLEKLKEALKQANLGATAQTLHL